jgi:hypothetical protein
MLFLCALVNSLFALLGYEAGMDANESIEPSKKERVVKPTPTTPSVSRTRSYCRLGSARPQVYKLLLHPPGEASTDHLQYLHMKK